MRPFLWRKTRNVNRRALAGGAKKLYENEPKKKNGFFLYFRNSLRRFKNRNICPVLNWYTSPAKFLLEFEAKAHLRSFTFFSGDLGLLIWTHFGPFWVSYRIILNILRVFWARLCPFKPISVCLGLFRLA